MDTLKIKRRRKAKPSLGAYIEGDYKWAVYYVREDGKRVRRKFCQKADALSFLADKLVEVENLGMRIASTLDDATKRDAYTANEMLKPFGKTVLDAANHYRAHLEAGCKSSPINELIEGFMEAKLVDGKSERYTGDVRNRLRPFTSKFGTRYASEVTAKEIQEWLGGLSVGGVSRNNFRRVICTFFSWCWRLGYCPENPVLKVTRVKEPPVQISAPGDA